MVPKLMLTVACFALNLYQTVTYGHFRSLVETTVLFWPSGQKREGAVCSAVWINETLFRYNFRYGFVTYDSQDSVDNALKDSDNLNLHGKKLNIGRAVRKQPPMQPGYTDPNAMMNTWMYHPGGYASLTGQTGVTYFVAPTNQIPQFVSPYSMYRKNWNQSYGRK